MNRNVIFVFFRYTLILVFFFHKYAVGQIVNIESRRFQTDTVGWKGSANIGFSMGKQRQTFFILNASAHVQYKSKKHLYLLLGSNELLKSKSDNYVNAGFVHFRHNYSLKIKWLRWESFTQAQFNQINGLRLRYLLGSGMRFKVLKYDNYRMYIGTLYMYEHEVNIDRTQKLNEFRFSGYLSFVLRPTEIVEFISTTYYQPNVAANKDFRLSTQNSIKLRVHKNFNLGMNFVLNYDSSPPVGAVTNLTYLWSNNLIVDF